MLQFKEKKRIWNKKKLKYFDVIIDLSKSYKLTRYTSKGLPLKVVLKERIILKCKQSCRHPPDSV